MEIAPLRVMQPKLSEVMTPFPYSVSPDVSAHTAHDLLNKHGVRHLAVLHQGEIVGVLSDRDVNLALQLDDGKEAANRTPVFAICSKPAYVVDANESLKHVVQTMAEHRFGCALITSERKLAGILTTTDVCRLLAERLADDE